MTISISGSHHQMCGGALLSKYKWRRVDHFRGGGDDIAREREKSVGCGREYNYRPFDRR